MLLSLKFKRQAAFVFLAQVRRRRGRKTGSVFSASVTVGEKKLVAAALSILAAAAVDGVAGVVVAVELSSSCGCCRWRCSCCSTCGLWVLFIQLMSWLQLWVDDFDVRAAVVSIDVTAVDVEVEVVLVTVVCGDDGADVVVVTVVGNVAADVVFSRLVVKFDASRQDGSLASFGLFR